jgi:hypothetical protein
LSELAVPEPQRVADSKSWQLTERIASHRWVGFVSLQQVIKVRLQSKAHVGHYANSWDCVRKVVAAEGLGALGRGLGATCTRNSVWNAVYFGLMHVVNNHERVAAVAPTAGVAAAAWSLAVRRATLTHSLTHTSRSKTNVETLETQQGRWKVSIQRGGLHFHTSRTALSLSLSHTHTHTHTRAGRPCLFDVSRTQTHPSHRWASWAGASPPASTRRSMWPRAASKANDWTLAPLPSTPVLRRRSLWSCGAPPQILAPNAASTAGRALSLTHLSQTRCRQGAFPTCNALTDRHLRSGRTGTERKGYVRCTRATCPSCFAWPSVAQWASPASTSSTPRCKVQGPPSEAASPIHVADPSMQLARIDLRPI